MNKIFVAVNGDDVGSSIGQAIAADDHDGLNSTSESINQSHGMISEWAEGAGGKVVTSSGDEGIYVVPEEALQQLEQIRSQYKQMSGHDLTVGIGSSMSEASKALIYGKLNGKNQVVEYSPEIDDQISGGEMPGEAEDVIDPAAQEIPPNEEIEEGAVQDEEIDAGIAPPTDPEMGMDGKVEGEDFGTDPNNPEFQPEMAAQDPSMQDPSMQDPMDDNAQVGMDGMEEDPESPYEELAPETEADQDSEEDYDHNNALTDMIHGQMEGGEEPPVEGGVPEEGGVPNEQGFPQEEEGGEQGFPQEEEEEEGGIPGEEQGFPQEEEEEEEEGGEFGADQDGDIEGADDGLATDEEVGNEDQLDDELKEDISAALMSFKENKHLLEEAKQASPELYDAMITMLRSMIHMAKRLGYGPEQDIVAAEEQADAEGNFPPAEGELPEEKFGEASPEEEDEGEEGFLEDEGEEGFKEASEEESEEDSDEDFPGKKQ